MERRTICLYSLACKRFNEDFNGDQMNVHVLLPLSLEAQAERRIPDQYRLKS